MKTTLAIVLVALAVLSLGVAMVAIESEPVVADNCGGPGQVPCEDYCVYHPLATECQEDGP